MKQKKQSKYIAWFSGLRWGWVKDGGDDWVWVENKKDAQEFKPDDDWDVEETKEILQDAYPHSIFVVED